MARSGAWSRAPPRTNSYPQEVTASAERAMPGRFPEKEPSLFAPVFFFLIDDSVSAPLYLTHPLQSTQKLSSYRLKPVPLPGIGHVLVRKERVWQGIFITIRGNR